MTALMVTFGFFLGVVVGFWACWGWQRQVRWDTEWRHATHPVLLDPGLSLGWLDLDELADEMKEKDL